MISRILELGALQGNLSRIFCQHWKLKCVPCTDGMKYGTIDINMKIMKSIFYVIIFSSSLSPFLLGQSSSPNSLQINKEYCTNIPWFLKVLYNERKKVIHTKNFNSYQSDLISFQVPEIWKLLIKYLDFCQHSD